MSVDQIMRRLSAPPVAMNLPVEEAATVRMEAVWWLYVGSPDLFLLPFVYINLVGRRRMGGGGLLGGLRLVGGGGDGVGSFHFIRVRSFETV